MTNYFPPLVRHFSAQYRMRTGAMVALLAVGGLFEGFGIAAVLPVVRVASGDTGGPDRLTEISTSMLAVVGLEPTLAVLLGVLVVLMTLKGVVLLIAMQHVGFIVAQVAMELRLRLLRAVTDAEWGHLLRYPTGYLTNAISLEAKRSADAYREFCGALADGAQVLVYVALAFAISWKTAVIAIVIGFAIMKALRGFVTRTRHAGREQTERMKSVLSRMTDVLPGLKPLKAMGRQGYLLPILESDTLGHYNAQKQEIIAREVIAKVREPIVVAVLAVGMWGALTISQLPFSSVMLLGLLFYRTVTGVTKVQSRWASVVSGEAAFDSFMDHVRGAEGARETWDGTVEAPPLSDALVFEDVSYWYDEGVPVLSAVQARLESGAFVVLVGPSGGGKSTFIDLVTGLIRPRAGRIVIDGKSLSTLDVATWRRQIGYVPQELRLISDTVRMNVTLGDVTVTDEQVLWALRQAGAHTFVVALQGGLDARIGEGGTSLSGGQRQRLAIARALVAAPRFLVLDEPTTALDRASEREVIDTILSLRGELTILAVSHQPALREHADNVWELDGGTLTMSSAPPGAAAVDGL